MPSPIKTTLLATGLLLFCGTSTAWAAQYGAIAYDAKTHSYGTSSQQDTREDAEQAALGKCEDALEGRRGHCTLELWFKNSYGALAEGDDGFGTGRGSNKNEAQEQALKVCERYTENCDITVTIGAE